MEVTIKDILNDMHVSGECDAYYYDAIHNVGYHIHEFINGQYKCFKNNGRHIVPIIGDEFIKAVNYDCHLNSIGEDNYYHSFIKY